MKAIVEAIYGFAKKYMLDKAKETGNQQFVDQLNAAFTSIENVWKLINTKTPPKK
jgi:hypothetical protein